MKKKFKVGDRVWISRSRGEYIQAEVEAVLSRGRLYDGVTFKLKVDCVDEDGKGYKEVFHRSRQGIFKTKEEVLARVLMEEPRPIGGFKVRSSWVLEDFQNLPDIENQVIENMASEMRKDMRKNKVKSKRVC